MVDENDNSENVSNENAETQPIKKEGEKAKASKFDKPEISITIPLWNDYLKELGYSANNLSHDTIELIKIYGLNRRELEKLKAEYDKSTNDITISSRGGRFRRLDATNNALDKQICDAIKLEYKEAQEAQEEPEVKPEVKAEEKKEEVVVEIKEEAPVEKTEEPPVETRRKRIGFFRLRR